MKGLSKHALLAYQYFAVHSPSGVVSDQVNMKQFTLLCMGVVKLDDPAPNWDTEVMAKGKDWRRG